MYGWVVGGRLGVLCGKMAVEERERCEQYNDWNTNHTALERKQKKEKDSVVAATHGSHLQTGYLCRLNTLSVAVYWHPRSYGVAGTWFC